MIFVWIFSFIFSIFFRIPTWALAKGAELRSELREIQLRLLLWLSWGLLLPLLLLTLLLLSLWLRELDNALEEFVLLGLNEFHRLAELLVRRKANVVALLVSPHQAKRRLWRQIRIQSHDFLAEIVVTSDGIFLNFKASNLLSWEFGFVWSSVQNRFYAE